MMALCVLTFAHGLPENRPRMIPIFQIVVNRLGGVRPLSRPQVADRQMAWHCHAALSAAWNVSDGPDPHLEWIEERELRSGLDRQNSGSGGLMFSGIRSAEVLLPTQPGLLEGESVDSRCSVPPVDPTPPMLGSPGRAPEATLAAALEKLARHQSLADGQILARSIRKRLNSCFDGSAPRFYREAGISRSTYSKIMSHPDVYRPDRETTLQMARAFQLPLEEAVRFLALAGHALSPDSPDDRVWAVCFELGLYHRLDVESLLRRARKGMEMKIRRSAT